MPQHECTFGYFAQHRIKYCDIKHLHKLLQIIMSNNMHDTLLSTPSISSSRRRRRTPSLKLFQVAHQDVGSVVVQRLHDVVPGRELVTSCQLCPHLRRGSPAILAEDLLDVLHVITLLVFDHLQALVCDEFRLLKKLAVVSSGFGNPVTQPCHKLFFTLLV